MTFRITVQLSEEDLEVIHRVIERDGSKVSRKTIRRVLEGAMDAGLIDLQSADDFSGALQKRSLE